LLIARLYLPSVFSVSFEVTVPSLGPSLDDDVLVEDVFLLKLEDESGGNLLGLALTPASSTKLIYQDSELTSSGVELSDMYSTEYTRFQINVMPSSVSANSDVNSSWSPVYATTNVNTTGHVYSLYASCGDFQGWSGSIKDIVFNSKIHILLLL
jgi:hypothetical protein